ncbi:gsl0741 [Gloeobacter violaceus PCC 7421]|uniref:Gsl0741 protein n=1 Tax=Gloeobacter violaceus (strain ATCC 29082 / PCC 7421) TaxID=251221 RepID=Q7NMM4_GLOVI|nr:gsl0741 [Gloeobacter violaceus PCC 7421]
MIRQMCWLPMTETGGMQVLHLRTHPSQPWVPYNQRPEYVVSDYNEPDGSKGWACYQKLLRAGWSLVPTSLAMHEPVLSERLESA